MNVCVQEPCWGAGHLHLPLPLPVRSAGNLLPVFQASGGGGEVGEEGDIGGGAVVTSAYSVAERLKRLNVPHSPRPNHNLELSGLPVMQPRLLPP